MSCFYIGARTSGALLAYLTLSAGIALAEPRPSPSPSPSAPPEIGRVVTTDRADEALANTAKTTYVVGKQQMILRGDRTIAEALEGVPGVIVQPYGALGALNDVSIRGSSSQQVLVLLDGRPYGGAQTGTLDLGEISTSDVERIEIVEGGGSTLYGNGAIGGVINIITKARSHDPLFAKLAAGSFSSGALDFESRNFTFERSLAANDYGFAGGAVPAAMRLNDDLASTTARLRGDARLGAIAVDGSLGFAQVALGVPGPLVVPPPQPGAYQSTTTRQDTDRGDARLSFTFGAPQSSTQLNLSATRQRVLFYSLPGDPNGCYTAAGTQPCNDFNEETRTQVDLQHTIASAANRLIFGVEVAHGTARIDAGGGAAPVNGFAQTALYAQDNAKLGAFNAYAGVRAERDGGQGGAISPSLGFVAHLLPALALRANFATAFRAPNAVDLYYPGFSNPNLAPERTAVSDVTLSHEASSGSVSLGYFTEAATNLITPNADFTQEVNIGRASIAGLTFDARSKPLDGVSARLSITNLYRALDLTTSEQRLARRPVLSTSLALEYGALSPRAALAAAGIVAQTVSARPPYVAASVPYDPYLNANTYTSIDAYLRFRPLPRTLLSLRAWNLGDERYAVVAGYPMPGRAFGIELSNR